uniref:Uncharacterized protein n=1 Tax=Nelumbo nucifera TaxID=4432 RepID=A0A822X9H4_NELNU|nr:TPA_asm: hypothetical protein HUJ06_019587 [Nelumbo nucifera]
MSGDKVRTRCSPKRFREMLYSLFLSLEHKRRFQQTPFGHFLDLPQVTVETFLLGYLVKSWDSTSHCFIVGERTVQFSEVDVALITGLGLSGSTMPY